MRPSSLFPWHLQILILKVSSIKAKRYHAVSSKQQQGPSRYFSLDDPVTIDSPRMLDTMPAFDKDASFSTEKLRNDLLENYDKGTYPWEYVWNITKMDNTGGDPEIRKGLEIGMNMNFHKIFEVDTITSILDLLVWLRMSWNDPRLSWDPADYNGTTKTWFWIEAGSGMGENSEIWTPDILLWNFETGLSESLSDTFAQVSHNGDIYWSRPGHLRPACKFRGLEDFPFDTLKCTLEFGSWIHSGLYIRPVGMDGGYAIGGSDTSGEAFPQFTLEDVIVEEKVYPPYPVSPEEDWPVLQFHLAISRAWEPIARGFMVVQILLNLVGFAAMWLPVDCGERMGLVITSVLAGIASDLAVASQLPLSSEFTWFAKFSAGTTVFAVAVVFECVAVIYFYYNTNNDLKPNWYKVICKRICKKRSEKEKNEIPQDRDKDNIGFKIELRDQDNDDFENDLSEDDFDDNEQDDKVTSLRNYYQNQSTVMRHSIMKKAENLEGKEMENNIKWQEFARYIDEISRPTIVGTYVLFLAVIFAF